MRLLIATALVAASTACAPLVCTEMGCSGSLELTFEKAAWDDGEYTLSADLGGAVQTCTFSLPLSDDAWCDAFAITQDGGKLVVPVWTGMDESLADVAVVLSTGDQVLVDETIAPAWSDPFYPNGKACDGQGCMSANWTFSL